jgi:MoaA/NifB/PqqE/SkfB family radical SAM enzyme
MTKLVAIHRSDKYALVTWDFGNICNYNCWYCLPEAHAGTARVLSGEVLLDFTNAMIQHFLSAGRHLYLNFAGGEPTLSPNLGSVAALVRQDPESRICICSNGSKSLQWWRETRRAYDYVTLTFHAGNARLNEFMAVAEYLASESVLDLNIVMDPSNWDCCLDAYESLCLIENTSVWAKPMLVHSAEGSNVCRYTSDQYKWLLGNSYVRKEQNKCNCPLQLTSISEDGRRTAFHPGELLLSNRAAFQGWICSVGLSSLHISHFGEVRTSICGAKTIGNIEQPKTILWPTENVVCERAQCSCAVDIAAPKVLRSESDRSFLFPSSVELS